MIGMIVSNNKSLLTKLILERTMDYHQEILVIILADCRLDEIHASILNAKLNKLIKLIE